MAEPKSIMIALIDIDDAFVPDFHRWYDEEHVPERLAVPGIENARRWVRVSGDLPRFLASYDLSDAEVLEAGAYRVLKDQGDSPCTMRIRTHFQSLIRGVFNLTSSSFGPATDASACAIAITHVEPAELDAYHRWYLEEHGPAISAVPGVVALRRYEREAGPSHLTILELSDPSVLESGAYADAKSATLAPSLRSRWQRQQGVFSLLTAGRPE